MHSYINITADYSSHEGIEARVTVWVAGSTSPDYVADVGDVTTKEGFDALVAAVEGLKGPIENRAEFRRMMNLMLVKALLRLEQRVYTLHECDTQVFDVTIPIEAYEATLKKAIIAFLQGVATTLHKEGEAYELFVGLARYVAAKTALFDAGVGGEPYSLGEIYALSKEILDTTAPEEIGGVEKRAAAIGAQLLTEKAEAAFQMTSDAEYEALEALGIL